MNEAPELVGVGNALVDIVAFSDEEIATVLDLPLNRAIHVGYERFAELIAAMPAPAMSAGGGSANTVKIASLLGVRSAFVGRVGSDHKGKPDRFARLFEDELKESGAAAVLARGTEPTGGCLVIRMPGGNFSIAACPSAAMGLEAEDLNEDLVRSAKVLALDGYLLGREALVRRALSLADSHGTAVALDVGSETIAAQFAVSIAKMAAAYPLILFLNEAEAAAFCTGLRPGERFDDVEDYAPLRSMTESGPFPIVVVKRGPRGALTYASGACYDAPARFAVPLDATGAGDSFAAGFLSAWIRNRSLTACAALGNRVAREIIAVPGTRIDGDKLKRLSRAVG